jgi:alkaline phosphatase D
MDRRGATSASSIAFGSCNRQDKPQDFWATLRSLQPSHFLWVGDAVYAKGNSVEKLQKAYENLTSNAHYGSFEESTVVDGVWDDHDCGINDVGKFVPDKEARQRLYAGFIRGAGGGRGGHGSTLSEYDERIGLYHHTDIRIGDATARFYFLDTRSQRDYHWIRSVGEVHIKGSALVASALRVSYSLLGWGTAHSGSVLGNEQWMRFEDSLRSSKADLNVVISSVQVLTTNPVFESWGHFPTEKRRLFALLQEIDPKNLVFLSGDVHLGELSRASYTRSDGSLGQWVEVTSSGLTHTCADGLVNKYLCPFMMWVFSLHRLPRLPALPGAKNHENVFFGRNFGTIYVESDSEESDSKESEPYAVFSVRSVETAKPVLTHTVKLQKLGLRQAPIVSVEYPSFPVLPHRPVVLGLCGLRVCVLLVLYSILLITRRKNLSNKSSKSSKSS